LARIVLMVIAEETTTMNKTSKRKLNLSRETLVELKPDTLDLVQGGQAAAAFDGSYAVICISQNKRSCVVCG
jgi:hypothetical protein